MEDKSQIVLQVMGMTCDGCAQRVEGALRQVPGVSHAEVLSWKSGQVVVMAAARGRDSDLVEAVKRAGYPATVREVRPAKPRGLSAAGTVCHSARATSV